MLFCRILGASILFAALFSSHTASAGDIPGAILSRNQAGHLVPSDANLFIAEDWKTITLTVGQTELHAGAAHVKDGRVYVAFRNLPGAAEDTVLVLEGKYNRHGYRGQALIKEHNELALTDLLGQVAARKLTGFGHHASFFFGEGETINGVPVVRGPVLDSNNPCPAGPCWTNGGRGRQLEYYPGGPIQNPGRAHPPAGFERGLPYALTRQGQLAAQQIGIQRAQALRYRNSYNNNFSWGFFFLLR